MRRGDIRPALLDALGDGPGHGYELMRRLSERSGGRWRPSPGSVYPTLQMLEEEGLVRGQESEGKKVYQLTDTGRADVDTRAAQSTDGPPWAHGGNSGHGDLREAVGQLMAAARQVATTGSPELVAEATAIVTETRRKLYELLARA